MPSQDNIDRTLDAADAPPPDSDLKPDSPPHLAGASWKYALKRAVKEFSTDGGTDLAAMLTYYTVLSLAPALLAVFSIITLVFANNSGTVTSLVEDLVATYVPADYQALVVDLVDTVTGSATGGIIALVIGIATALWSASAYVKAFSRSMNIIYEREEGRGLVKQTGTMLLITLVLLLGVVLILASIALNEALVTGLFGPIAKPLGLGGALEFMVGTFLPIWAWVKWPVILALVVVMVAVLYYYAPNVRQPKFSWVSLGSIVAILGIALAGVVLSIYLTQFAGYSSYGAIGTVMALLFVLWVFNIMLLLGAEVDAEVERARQLQAGLAAESAIQLPPRGIKKVEKMRDARDKLHEEARALRQQDTAGTSAEAEETTTEETGTDAEQGSAMDRDRFLHRLEKDGPDATPDRKA